jgi:hypothetical protein
MNLPEIDGFRQGSHLAMPRVAEIDGFRQGTAEAVPHLMLNLCSFSR